MVCKLNTLLFLQIMSNINFNLMKKKILFLGDNIKTFFIKMNFEFIFILVIHNIPQLTIYL
jgi:hypothetical protein